MKPWIPLTLLLSALPALALGYPEALARADDRPPVVAARAELDDAEAQWARTEADPAALRLERLQARQRRELAAAQLRLERVRASAEISLAYTQLLDAQAAYRLAERGFELAGRTLRVARLRYVKGGIGRQELRASELRLEEARNRLRQADDARALARARLFSLVGGPEPGEALAPAGTPVLPDLEAVYRHLDAHPDLLRAAQGVELAQTALALLDPSYAPRARIEAAQLQLTQARTAQEEVRRGLRLQAKARWQAVAERRRAFELARAENDKAARDLDVARERYRAGLISELALLQAELEREQAAVAVQNAEHALLAAAWELAVATAWPLEVQDAR